MDNQQQDFEGRMKEFHATTTDLWEISRNTMLQVEADILRSLGIKDSWVVGDEEAFHWKDAMEAQLCEQGLQDRVIVADLDFKSWSIEFATFTVEIQENDETQKVTCLQVLEYYPGGGSLIYRVPQSVRSLVKPARTEG
jgi:hypothetical protein